MCGIWGFSGPQAPDINKLKILGIFNQSRGGHSCGIYYNGEIKKGVDKLAKFSDFIQEEILFPAEDAHVFLGHARYATIGMHSEKNAHPFQVNNLIGVHNGVIKNTSELEKKYDIKPADWVVDSHLLFQLLEKEGPKILSEYIGFAAILMHNINEPDSIYAFHGSSVKTKGGIEYEERPLYYMKTPEGIYLSSMKESLNAIRNSTEEAPHVLEYNKLIKITNGRMTKSRVEINRDEINIGVDTHSNYYGSNYGNYEGGYWSKNTYQPPVKSNLTPVIVGAPKKVDKNMTLILMETMPQRGLMSGSRVFFHRGRYWSSEEGKQGYSLAHGRLFINKKGELMQGGDIMCNTHPDLVYYFYSGVMLKNKKAYDDLVAQSLDEASPGYCFLRGVKYNFAMFISSFSKYPVTNLTSEAVGLTPEFKHSWYLNGRYATLGLSPKFSDRQYQLKSGVCLSISSPNKKESPLTQNILMDVPPKEEKGNDGVTENIQDTFYYTEEIESLLKYCDREYKSMDEMEADVPATILRALELYAADLLEDKFPELENENESTVLDKIYQHIIDDGVTIRELLLETNNDIAEYVMDAREEELDEILEENELEVEELSNEDMTKMQEEIDSTIEKINEGSLLKFCTEMNTNTLVGYLKSLTNIADKLVSYISSDWAQQAAYNLYIKISDIKTTALNNLEQERKEYLMYEWDVTPINSMIKSISKIGTNNE